MDKVDAYGLQAADMTAWIMTRLRIGALRNQTMSAFGPVIGPLVEGWSDRYQIFHPDQSVLQRFFAEQAAGPRRVLVTDRRPPRDRSLR